jgi:hypothetical protein
MSGFVQIHRQLLDNPVFNSDAEAMAFAWMVLRASWRPVSVRYKGREIDLERGQLCMSVRDMAERLERSKDWVSRFLTRLEKAKMIEKHRDRGCLATATPTATATATASNVITICNYDKYQANSETTATAPRQHVRQDRDSTATQNKEGNKGIRDNTSVLSLRARGKITTIVDQKVIAEPVKKNLSLIPSGFEPQPFAPSSQCREIIDDWPTGRLQSQVDLFTAHHQSRGTKMANWQMAWKTWVLKSKEYGNANNRRNAENRNSNGQGLDGFTAAMRYVADGDDYAPFGNDRY